jgi:hypothetical protein
LSKLKKHCDRLDRKTGVILAKTIPSVHENMGWNSGIMGI